MPSFFYNLLSKPDFKFVAREVRGLVILYSSVYGDAYGKAT